MKNHEENNFQNFLFDNQNNLDLQNIAEETDENRLEFAQMFNGDDHLKASGSETEGVQKKWNIANILSAYEEEIISHH
jgi:oligoribonuclease NrnB/cAMP/cGMP phosphodiesterase (DHH superfamily)